ncbi:hypothetical protein IV454_18795 [Massilia antarctica]|uniref:DUF4124 domain-containing protein n=1 Tax=Massilia antarctica TaxID=2765360 RepID=A0AA48W9X7_9BURK|nr:hypothetical protein [Massilia antarctica]QPI47634.1 hypothetical protein IV454_18795 [Massilia antarctica]
MQTAVAAVALSGAMARLGCLLLAALGMPAQSALFKYLDPVTRVASYTNYRPSQPGARELVPRLDAPARRGAPGARAPAFAAASVPRPEPGPGPGPGPANFPRIDATRQRELDAGRRYIIGTELQAAEAELARLLAGAAAPEHIGRRRGDVAALRRELERLP